MKKARKMTALLMVLFLLTMMLSACGASQGAPSAKSNTGVWIAITVMVFVAVFSATSGVV